MATLGDGRGLKLGNPGGVSMAPARGGMTLGARPGLTLPAGDRVPGPQGETGPRGATGATGATGARGADGTDAHFVHVQSVPAASWQVTHNLGRRSMPTLLLDDEPSVPVETDVVFADDNTLTVIWPSPVTGRVYI